MPAHRVRRSIAALIDRYVPWPSTILGLILVAIFCLAVAGLGWAPTPGQSTGSAPTVTARSTVTATTTITLTPDDPAAPYPVPVQSLGR